MIPAFSRHLYFMPNSQFTAFLCTESYRKTPSFGNQRSWEYMPHMKCAKSHSSISTLHSEWGSSPGWSGCIMCSLRIVHAHKLLVFVCRLLLKDHLHYGTIFAWPIRGCLTQVSLSMKTPSHWNFVSFRYNYWVDGRNQFKYNSTNSLMSVGGMMSWMYNPDSHISHVLPIINFIALLVS